MLKPLIVATLAVTTPATAAQDPEAAVKIAMDASAAAWSSGDMDRFMALYADEAVFVTKDGLVRGKAAIAARYASSYGVDPAKRGTLTFQILGGRGIGNAHRMLWARWTLSYPGGKSDTGLTSLVFERLPGGWKIVSDHSS